MNSRVMTMGSILLYVLSVGIGLAWWFVAWRSGVLAKIPPPGSNILLGLCVIQVLASVVIPVTGRETPRADNKGAVGLKAIVMTSPVRHPRAGS